MLGREILSERMKMSKTTLVKRASELKDSSFMFKDFLYKGATNSRIFLQSRVKGFTFKGGGAIIDVFKVPNDKNDLMSLVLLPCHLVPYLYVYAYGCVKGINNFITKKKYSGKIKANSS